MYSIQAHDGSVQSLAYSASYVLSLGTDDKLCVWERFQGHLLNTISIVGLFHRNYVWCLINKCNSVCSLSRTAAAW